MKRCPRCKTWKPLLAYFRYASGKPAGYCKVCSVIAHREWSQCHPQRDKAIRLRCSYGLKKSDYHALIRKQKGKCKICERKPKGGGLGATGRLVIDHCHSQGKVRGMLCMQCNIGLGMFQHSKKYLAKAVRYLARIL